MGRLGLPDSGQNQLPQSQGTRAAIYSPFLHQMFRGDAFAADVAEALLEPSNPEKSSFGDLLTSTYDGARARGSQRMYGPWPSRCCSAVNGYRQDVNKARRQPQPLARYDTWEHRSEEEQRTCIEHWTVVLVADIWKICFARWPSPRRVVAARAAA